MLTTSPTIHPATSVQPEETPFEIEHYATLESAMRFTPHARLVLRPSLRTCGLLGQLTDEEARTLLAVLSCLNQNAHIDATIPEIAGILNLSEQQAGGRLRRLAAVQWRGMPLLRELPRETGLHAFSPSPALVSARQDVLPLPGHSTTLAVPPLVAASRESIIAHSRAHYSTPRAVAERMVAEQLGRAPEELEDTPEGEARRNLRSLGVARDEVDRLVATYSLEAISRQVAWMPLRGAKSPARFVIAAIEGDYAPPHSIVSALPPAQSRTESNQSLPSDATTTANPLE